MSPITTSSCRSGRRPSAGRRTALNDQFVALRAPAEEAIGFDILFQKVPEPKVAKNRAHIDFDAADMEAEVERLVGLGGTKVAEHNLGAFRWTIVADPEGNEFCVTIR